MLATKPTPQDELAMQHGRYLATALKPLSLNKRILASIAIMFLLGFATLAIYLLDASKQLRRALAHVEAKALIHNYQPGDDINSLPKFYTGQELSYTLYSPSGKLLSMSSNLKQPRRLRNSVITPSRWLPSFDGVGFVINVPVYFTDGHILMVARNDESNRVMIDDVLQATMQSSVSILIPMVVFFITAIWGLLYWTLRPIKKAAQVALAITPNALQTIPTAALPYEVKPLAEAANDAMQRLAHAYQAEQRFVADAAHELRTPLALLYLRLHRINNKNCPDIQAIKSDVEKLQNLVSQLLQLARLDGITEIDQGNIEKFDLCRLARQLIADHISLFEQQARDLFLCVAMKKIVVFANQHLLKLAIANLLSNALYHGRGRVQFTLDQRDNHVFISVSDQGCSPNKDSRNALFQRFKKQQENSSGSGLGLSITQQIVGQLKGRVYFADEVRTTVVIELPQCI